MNIPDASSPAARLDSALDEGRRHLSRARVIHTELARRADPGGPMEEALVSLLSERPTLANRLGMALLGWLAEDMARVADAAVPRGEAEEALNEADACSEPEPEEVDEQAEVSTSEETPAVDVTVDPGEAGEDAGTRDVVTALSDVAVPAPVEATAPEAAAPAADPASLAALRVGPSWSRGTPSARDAVISPSPEELTKALRATLATPFPGTVRAVAACDTLSIHLHHLGDCAREVLHALMSAWAAHARSVQDRVSGRSAELAQAFGRVIFMSKERQPGPVHGLNRKHQPVVTWDVDAQRWLRAAEELLAPTPASPERSLARLAEVADAPNSTKEEVFIAFEACRRAGVETTDVRLLRIAVRSPAPFAVGKSYSALRKAARELQADERKGASADLAEADADIDPDWPFFALTAGKRIAVVGADIKEDRRARLQTAFQAAELEWVSGNQLRQVQSLASRVRGGTVDMVWVLTAFCSHKVSDAMVAETKSSSAPVLLVRRGYGVQNVRLAIEGRFGGASAK